MTETTLTAGETAITETLEAGGTLAEALVAGFDAHGAEIRAAAAAEGLIAIDLDPAALALLAKFRAAREARDAAIKQLDELKPEIFALIDAEGAQALTFNDQVVARKSEVTSTSVDAKKLKAEEPDVYAKYIKVTTTTRLTVSE
jgi:predicted phage-related endonuclease